MSFNVLRNLSTIVFNVLEKVEDVPLEFIIRAVEVINTVSYRSPPQLRIRLKDTGLPEARNGLVTRCFTSKFVHHDLASRVSALAIIQSSIQNMLSSADPKFFQDSHVIIMILSYFVEISERLLLIENEFQQESYYELLDLQAVVVELVHMAVASSAECRRSLSRLTQSICIESENGSNPSASTTFRSTKSVILLSSLLNSFRNSTSDSWDAYLRESHLLDSGSRPAANASKSWFSWSSNETSVLPNIDIQDDFFDPKNRRRFSYDSDAESHDSGSGKESSVYSRDSLSFNGGSKWGSPIRDSARSKARLARRIDSKASIEDSGKKTEDERPADTAGFITWYNSDAQRYCR